MNDKINIFDPIDSQDSDLNLPDIGERIKQRALKSYGVRDFAHNIQLLEAEENCESDVKYLWNWFDCKNSLFEFISINNQRIVLHGKILSI